MYEIVIFSNEAIIILMKRTVHYNRKIHFYKSLIHWFEGHKRLHHIGPKRTSDVTQMKMERAIFRSSKQMRIDLWIILSIYDWFPIMAGLDFPQRAVHIANDRSALDQKREHTSICRTNWLFVIKQRVPSPWDDILWRYQWDEYFHNRTWNWTWNCINSRLRWHCLY